MTMQSLSDIVVFDLDDTIYKEVSFVRSGFKAIGRHLGHDTFADELISSWEAGKNAFETLIDTHSLDISVGQLLEIYRSHYPELKLDASTASVLDALVASGRTLGLITDGRSLTQRNKIKALGLLRWISDDNIIISEEFGTSKPNVRNYRFFMAKYPSSTFAYIGDNIAKDFVAAKSLGWQTICLKDDGQNIHPQSCDTSDGYIPDTMINNILELKYLI